jgi:glutamate-1-semialdehyde 2,1-aminomutase
MNVGGIHLTMGVEPDVAVLGKALGNGYAISAVIGRRKVLDCAQDSFISSTYWTERMGFAAALATLDKMERQDAPARLIRYGLLINDGWNRLADKHGLEIAIGGIPPLTHLTFRGGDPLAIQTYYTQEMLAKGFLLGASVYTTLAYSEEIIAHFLDESDPVFGRIGNLLESGRLRDELRHGVMDPGFKRLA